MTRVEATNEQALRHYIKQAVEDDEQKLEELS